MNPFLLPLPHRAAEHRLCGAVPGRSPAQSGPHPFHLLLFKFRTFSDYSVPEEVMLNAARGICIGNDATSASFGQLLAYYKVDGYL